MGAKNISLAICLSAALLSGCALTTGEVVIEYNPEQNAAPVSGASEVVIAVTVADERKVKTSLSRKTNSYGMELAPIVAVEDVPTTIRRAIEQELQSRGFQIGESASVQVEAELTRFYTGLQDGLLYLGPVCRFEYGCGRQVESR